MTKEVGLRIDVDTFRGTRFGVPALANLLIKYNADATFYFSVGPDNMGRHVWRLLKPKFLLKMLRSNAPGLYGWDILLQGTFWPGRNIGNNFKYIIQDVDSSGFEVGLHAWDHYLWQTWVNQLSKESLIKQLSLGVGSLEDILGYSPRTSACAGWRSNDLSLQEKERFGFVYNSDCRGTAPFRPIVDGRLLAPQLPVTLPTYDELIGTEGITDECFNKEIFNNIEKQAFSIYTVHAEVEGMSKLALFENMLKEAKQRDIQFVKLHRLLPHVLPEGKIIESHDKGREGWISCQQPLLKCPV